VVLKAKDEAVSLDLAGWPVAFVESRQELKSGAGAAPSPRPA